MKRLSNGGQYGNYSRYQTSTQRRNTDRLTKLPSTWTVHIKPLHLQEFRNTQIRHKMYRWFAKSFKCYTLIFASCRVTISASKLLCEILDLTEKNIIKILPSFQGQSNIIFPNLTLYAPCIILQYVYEPTRCTKFLWLDFIFIKCSTCFRLY